MKDLIRSLADPTPGAREEAMSRLCRWGGCPVAPAPAPLPWLLSCDKECFAAIAEGLRTIVDRWTAWPNKPPSVHNLVFSYLMTELACASDAAKLCELVRVEVEHYGKKVRLEESCESLGPSFFVADDDYPTGNPRSGRRYQHVGSAKGGDYYAEVTTVRLTTPLPFSESAKSSDAT